VKFLDVLLSEIQPVCYLAVNMPHPKEADERSLARHALRLILLSRSSQFGPKRNNTFTII